MSSFESGLVLELADATRPLSAGLDAARDAGVPSCLRDAVRQYARYVIGLLGRLGVAAADVEDVAQEVYLAIHAELPSFQARASFKTWLCGVCRHKAADYRRKRARRWLLTSTRPAELASDAECPQGALLQQEAKEALRRAIAKLPDEQLEVFVLHAVEDLPMRDVAALVGCPIDTAYTRYRVALARVKAFCQRAERATGEP
jgi:RNA polymerase sigma-70 factor (ECF subfamily)